MPEVRDVEAALRVAANPDDSTAFVRLLSAGPWRLDAAEILRVTNAAAWDGRPVHQAASDILREGEIIGVGAARRRARRITARASSRPWPRPRSGTPTEFDESEPQTVASDARREQRAQQRREQLDARLRVKLERVEALVNELVPRAQRDGPFAVLEDFLVRTNLLHDLIAVETPEAQRTVLAARALHALRRRLAGGAPAREPHRLRRVSRRLPAGRRRPGHGPAGPRRRSRASS